MSEPFCATLYRGNDQAYSGLMRSHRGSFGAGIYFAGKASEAETYGEFIQEADIELRSPWRIEADWDSKQAMAEDFDSPCVDAILSLPGGRTLLEHSKATDGFYGVSLTQLLQSIGYDGIVATYPDGSVEVCVFKPSSVCHWRNHNTIAA